MKQTNISCLWSPPKQVIPLNGNELSKILQTAEFSWVLQALNQFLPVFQMNLMIRYPWVEDVL